MAEKIQKTHKQIVFDGCVSGVSALPEAQRMEVMQGLLNLFLDGLLCDNPQPMTLIDSADGAYRMLVKLTDAEKIMALRKSVETRH